MLEVHHIVRLFTFMTFVFGPMWTSRYGLPLGENKKLTGSATLWLHALNGYTYSQIKFGMDEILRKRPEWPPGPIQFMNLCDGVPSVAQVRDRAVDYGPMCAAIRSHLNWEDIGSLRSSKVDAEIAIRMEGVLLAMKRKGTYRAIVEKHVAALPSPDNEPAYLS